MSLPYPHNMPAYVEYFPVIDEEFDRFELNGALEEALHAFEVTNLPHALMNDEH